MVAAAHSTSKSLSFLLILLCNCFYGEHRHRDARKQKQRETSLISVYCILSLWLLSWALCRPGKSKIFFFLYVIPIPPPLTFQSPLIQVLHHLLVIASSCRATESKTRGCDFVVSLPLAFLTIENPAFLNPSQGTSAHLSAPSRQIFKLKLFFRAKGSFLLKQFW